MNAGIQGLAADIFKVALVRLDRALEDRGLASRLVLQVHDEVILEVPPAEEDGGRRRHPRSHARRRRADASPSRSTWPGATPGPPPRAKFPTASPLSFPLTVPCIRSVVIPPHRAEFTTLGAQQTRTDGMRRLFTTEEAMAAGLTSNALRWGEATGRWRRLRRGVYADGARGADGVRLRPWPRCWPGGRVASGGLAGVLHGLDGVTLDGRPVRRRSLPADRVVPIGGIRCTDGLQTMIDLAADLDDLRWEQALESALRKRLLSVADLERSLPALGRARVPGTARIRRVLELRPPGAAPTGSLLETLMVQLARTVPGLPPAVRQLPVGPYLLDQAWPDIGLFVELDGEQHLGQPVYDARRETAIVAMTGWLCGRFTWTEVVRVPISTARQLACSSSTRPTAARSSMTVAPGSRALEAW